MDELLAEIVREAEADPDTLAVILAGSRAVGHERPDSDYDLHYVRRRGEKPPPRANVEAAAITLEELRRLEPDWWTDGVVQGRVLVDKTGGELGGILERLRANNDVAGAYDAYLNAFVRGLGAARRGDELDRLAGTLGEWEPRLLEILRTADPELQRVLRRDVERLMEKRGVFTHREWGTSTLDRP